MWVLYLLFWIWGFLYMESIVVSSAFAIPEWSRQKILLALDVSGGVFQKLDIVNGVYKYTYFYKV
jgi:hypothetical protein